MEIIALLCYDKPTEIKYHPNLGKWYNCVLDIIDTKLFNPSSKTKKSPKSNFTVMLCNKEMEQINLNRIVKSEGSITHLTGKIQLQENIPVASYRHTTTIRNKILNYEETVQSIIVDDKISFSSSAGTCDCERSTFCDEHHNHIITGDLSLIANTKLRSLLNKGTNYREPNTINHSKFKIVIDSSIDNCINLKLSSSLQTIS